jgi:hypothetical protein
VRAEDEDTPEMSIAVENLLLPRRDSISKKSYRAAFRKNAPSFIDELSLNWNFRC